MPDKNKSIIDEIDHKILEILQNTGRDSASHIAAEIGMSVPAVSERIHKLEQNGIISGYEAIVDPKKVGLDVAALITLVSESSHHFEEVVKTSDKKLATNWIIGDLFASLNEKNISIKEKQPLLNEGSTTKKSKTPMYKNTPESNKNALEKKRI